MMPRMSIDTQQRPRILVVEDEIMIRILAADLLAELGFETEEAASAGEALQKVADVAALLQAAVVDVGLPDRRGDELVVELRALRPDLPLIIATGYGDADFLAGFASDPRIVIIPKPYDVSALSAALGQLHVSPPGAPEGVVPAA